MTADGRCLVLARWPSPFVQRAISVFLILVEFLFPLVFITYCYGRLFFRLKSRVSSTGRNTTEIDDKGGDRNAKARRNVLKTLINVSVCYVICWIWNQLYYAGVGLGVVERSQNSVYVSFSTFMIYVNCCINPIIYVIHYDQFKKGLRILRRRVFNASSVESTSGSSQPTGTSNIVTQ